MNNLQGIVSVNKNNKNKKAYSNMSETTTKETMMVERISEDKQNHVLQFVQTDFEKEGERNVPHYFAPDTDKETKAAIEEFFGPKWLWENVTWPRIKLICQQWTNAAAPDGDFQPSKFVKYVQQLSKRGESLKALQDKQMELLLQMAGLSAELNTDAGREKIKDIMLQVQDVAESIKEIEDRRAAEKAKAEAEKVQSAPATGNAQS